MSSIQPLDPTLIATAWKWVLRLEGSEDVNHEELSDWLRWYEADEAHKAAFDDMQSFWQQIDRMTDEPEPLSPTLWLGALPAPATQAVREAAAWHMSLGSLLHFPRLLGWTGAVLAIVIAFLLVQPARQSRRPARIEPSVTRPAAQLAQITTLSDGSRVELAPKSLVEVDYTPRQRFLRLRGGEGYFVVAHNPARPFIVAVGAIRVRAVGTAFNVRNAAERIVVTVVRGTVMIYPAAAGSSSAPTGAVPPGAISLTAGSEVTWTRAGAKIALVDPERSRAWRQGRLEYLNEPLASAVADLNRYRSRPVVIGNPAIGRIVFSGTVLTDDIDAWIASLPSLFPITIEHQPDGSLVLAGRPAGAGLSTPRSR